MNVCFRSAQDGDERWFHPNGQSCCEGEYLSCSLFGLLCMNSRANLAVMLCLSCLEPVFRSLQYLAYCEWVSRLCTTMHQHEQSVHECELVTDLTANVFIPGGSGCEVTFVTLRCAVTFALG